MRIARGLTLEQLASQTGLSKSALGKYEADDFKDISPFAIVTLAKFYEKSTDYLMGMTENKNHPSAELDALRLSDDAMTILKSGKFNHRLLSELICHPGFLRFMVDAEIYVDRIADLRINDLNAMLEAFRQKIIADHGCDENDLHLRTLELAQIDEHEFFCHTITEDMTAILKDIRQTHETDPTTADAATTVQQVVDDLTAAMNFEGSDKEKKVAAMLAALGIDYSTLTREEFLVQMRILDKSKHMKSPFSQRGKGKRK